MNGQHNKKEGILFRHLLFCLYALLTFVRWKALLIRLPDLS